MFQILLNERKGNPSAVDAFFASHPLEENRIADTKAQIARYDQSRLRGLTEDTPEFQEFRRRVKALPPSPKPKGS
jgi:predicted Zn-dependent protease